LPTPNELTNEAKMNMWSPFHVQMSEHLANTSQKNLTEGATFQKNSHHHENTLTD